MKIYKFINLLNEKALKGYSLTMMPKIGDKVEMKASNGGTQGTVYQVATGGHTFKLEDEYGNKNKKDFNTKDFKKAKIIRKEIKEEIAPYFEIEYYDNSGGHGGIGNVKTFKQAYSKAQQLYNREKKSGIKNGDTGYIGIGSNTDKFAIFYVDDDYINMIDSSWFNNSKDMKTFKDAALKYKKTGKPQIGDFGTKKEIKESAYENWVGKNKLTNNKYAHQLFQQLLRKHKSVSKFPDVVQGKGDKDFLVKEGKAIYVVDERHVGKFIIIMMQDPRTSTMRSAILKKNKVNKYNRNKQEDIDKLWALATKYKGKEITEGKSDYEVYHGTYGSAIDEIEKYANKKNYVIDEDDFSNAFTDAFFKPKKGKSYRSDLTLYKNDKKQKKALHTQIYNRDTDSNPFELNIYIN